MIKIPLQDPKRQNIFLENILIPKIKEVLQEGNYLLGRETDLFEKEFANYCQRRFCISTGNGTDALEIALRSVGCQPSHEVISVANAGGYTTAVCNLIGSTPVYVDIDDDLLMSAASVDQAITDRTKAVVVTHLYGKLANVDAINEVIKNRQIYLIEDCAQAHGATRQGKKAGSFGDLACFSFYPTKNLGTMGDGGAIVTNSNRLNTTIHQLRQYGWGENKYECQIPNGRNSRIDEIQASILRIKLHFLDKWNQQRRDIVRQYQDATAGKDIRILHSPATDYVAHLCIAMHKQRDKVREKLSKRGICTAIHYPILDYKQVIADNNTKSGKNRLFLSASEMAVNEIFTIPCFPEMTEGETDYVCKALGQYS